MWRQTQPHNIAQAFADVASAGISGKATFVSRGGTPGTTVEEHEIWALMSKLRTEPRRVCCCAPSIPTNGGGETPIAAGQRRDRFGSAMPGRRCASERRGAADVVCDDRTHPGPERPIGHACNGFPSGPNSCYVLTDRGTYDYLASGTDPAG